MRDRAILVMAMLAAMLFIFIGGCAQYNSAGFDTIEYMGLKYGPSERAVLEERLYYTGDTYAGMKLYAEGIGELRKVPLRLAIKDASGKYRAFSMMADNPPVYAYTPFVSYNLGEPVAFGLMNERGGRIELRNAAPYEAQKKENGEWNTIFEPVAAQVITPLENGTYKEWTWGQQYSGSERAGPGDYRVVIDGMYIVGFSITPGAPVVRAETIDYNNSTLQNAFWSTPEHKAFSDYYKNYSPDLRNDIEGQMLFKAWMKGLGADELRTALKAAAEYSRGLEMLPCLAVHASYNGQPAWIVVYNWGIYGESLSHIRYYVVDDATGQIIHFETCK